MSISLNTYFLTSENSTNIYMKSLNDLTYMQRLNEINHRDNKYFDKTHLKLQSKNLQNRSKRTSYSIDSNKKF